MFDYFKLALKALTLNKVRSALTMLGVIIGVAAVIILTALVGGIEKTVKTVFETFGANSLFVFPGDGMQGPSSMIANKFTYDMADEMKGVKGVVDVAALGFDVGNIKYKNVEIEGININAADESYFRVSSMGIDLGRAFSKSEANGGKMVTVIGHTVAENLFGLANPIGKEIKIKGKKFKVVGVYQELGAIVGTDQDNEVIIPLTVGRNRFDIQRPLFFQVRVDDEAKMSVVQKNVEKKLLRDLDEDEFSVMTQEQSLNTIGQILSVLATALGGIAAISLIVGGVGIMNIMFVSVTERTREIGLRKAVGASSRDILSQFLVEAVILSVCGGLLGVAVGFLASLAIGNFMDTAVNLFYVGLSFGVSAAIGIIFGVAPAIKASKMDPIVALRYE